MLLELQEILRLPITNLEQKPKIIAVYFIVYQAKVLYVGSTINLRNRINAGHKIIAKYKQVCIVHYLECGSIEQARELESLYIKKIIPIGNKYLLNNQRLSSTKLPKPQLSFLKIEAAKKDKKIFELLSDAVTKTYKVDARGMAVK